MNDRESRFGTQTTISTLPNVPAPSRRSVRRRAGAAPGRALTLAMLAVLGAAPFARAAGPKVRVTTPAELQLAVSDTANAGKTIVLAPGTYPLDPSGPTAGRLELQTDMELEGCRGRTEEVVIDAGLLPAASYQAGGLTGALRMGRGHNAVRWLTLRNATKGAAFVETDLAPTAPDTETSVTVERCIIEGNQRGIDLRLVGAAANGRTLRATFKDNILRDNALGMGQGLRIAILQGVLGATVRATVHGNSSTGNLAGLLAATNASSGSTIAIDSKSNHYSGNGIGCLLAAAIATGAAEANDNELTFDSHNDTFEGNDVPTAAYADAGAGLAVIGGESAAAAAGATDRNAALVVLRNGRFSANPAADLIVFGARGANGLVPGTENDVLVILRGGTRDPIVQQVASDPNEPTNRLTIVQHPGT